jgi:hypothetical protein
MLSQLRNEPHLTRKLTFWDSTFYEVEPLIFLKAVIDPVSGDVRISKKPSRARVVHAPRNRSKMEGNHGA